jgi:hypothetical protein
MSEVTTTSILYEALSRPRTARKRNRRTRTRKSRDAGRASPSVPWSFLELKEQLEPLPADRKISGYTMLCSTPYC